MPKGVTQYDLLISCPGDVQDEIKIIQEEVSQFNEQFSDVLGVAIRPRHWSYSSYAESGDKPQTLLNKQFVGDCDTAVAVFWTRFGTPTDTYGSGTEEEIELMITEGKQVFMYFSDIPVNPSKVDAVQYEKIKEFKKKYSGGGVYFSYSSTEDFGKIFAAHLAQHFLTIKKVDEIREAREPKLDFSLESEGDFCFTYIYPKLLVRQEIMDEDITQELIDDLKQQDKLLAKNGDMFALLRAGFTGKAHNGTTPTTDEDIDSIDYREKLSNEITAYNSDLPPQQVFDIYNENVTRFTNMTLNRQKFSICIKNNGTAVAKQATVTLRFPPEILVFEKYDVERIEKPDTPKIPQNPLRDIRISDKLTEIRLFSEGIASFDPSMTNNRAKPASHEVKPINYYENGKNHLSYSIDSLLHTIPNQSEDFYIVATQKGTYEIESEIICEELAEPMLKTFTVAVK